MSDFQLYLQLGLEHIADLAAYDHILFIVALCAVYQLKDWKAVLILVTAFTIGHSVTLALSTLDYVIVRSDIIEFLIPVTIFVTALFNVAARPKKRLDDKPPMLRQKYGIALFFGLIHGMGFSNYLKELLGAEESIVTPLLAFNIGLEIGQLIIVAAILALGFLVVTIFRLFKPREWALFISGAAAGISLILMASTKFGF